MWSGIRAIMTSRSCRWKNKLSLLLCLVVLCCVGTPAFAELSITYEPIRALERVSLEDAIAIMTDAAAGDSDLRSQLELLERMRRCSGTFVQARSTSTGKAYTANVEFFLKSGVPYCQVDYTNYSGTLGEGAVSVSDTAPYAFHLEPEGLFYSRTQQFSIDVGEENLHIAWGDSCDYVLDRGTGAVSDYENGTLPFEETAAFQEAVGVVDSFFGELPHHCRYDAGSRTLYTYFMATEGLYRTIAFADDGIVSQIADTLASLKEKILAFNPKLGAYVDLSVREGMGDYKNGHSAIVMVDQLNDLDDYAVGRDIIFEILDGLETYDLIAGLSSSAGAEAPAVSAPAVPSTPPVPQSTPKASLPSNPGPATTGQRNALQRAKEYLDVMPFSYQGLVEQLEYEGYTSSEAVYAADYCGADWNRQAAEKAALYLDMMPFSRDGLIEQLEYEGFTHSQAVYGASHNGY